MNALQVHIVCNGQRAVAASFVEHPEAAKLAEAFAEGTRERGCNATVEYVDSGLPHRFSLDAVPPPNPQRLELLRQEGREWAEHFRSWTGRAS